MVMSFLFADANKFTGSLVHEFTCCPSKGNRLVNKKLNTVNSTEEPMNR
jgi:hypothetical protein